MIRISGAVTMLIALNTPVIISRIVQPKDRISSDGYPTVTQTVGPLQKMTPHGYRSLNQRRQQRSPPQLALQRGYHAHREHVRVPHG